jgi:hypothetical protein
MRSARPYAFFSHRSLVDFSFSSHFLCGLVSVSGGGSRTGRRPRDGIRTELTKRDDMKSAIGTSLYGMADIGRIGTALQQHLKAPAARYQHVQT